MGGLETLTKNITEKGVFVLLLIIYTECNHVWVWVAAHIPISLSHTTGLHSAVAHEFMFQ